MTLCARCKALQGAEAQVLRLQKDVREFVKLLTNAREDGGLTKVQCEVFDKLVARHEAVLAGRAEDTPESPLWIGFDQGRPGGDRTSMTYFMTELYLQKITSHLIEGLTTDGAHHKQYHLEEALRLLVEEEFEETKKDWGWDDGEAA